MDVSIVTSDRANFQEIKIYYDKVVVVIRLEFFVVCIAITLYTMFTIHSYMECSIMLIVLIGLVLFNYRILINKNPQIIINNLGIATSKTPLYNWSEVCDVDVTEVQRGRGCDYYLTYAYPGGEEKVNLGSLNIEPDKLKEIIIVYNNKSKTDKPV